MARVSDDDRRDFEGYLRICTNDQVIYIYEKEKKANRRVYARLARLEAARRGIEDRLP